VLDGKELVPLCASLGIRFLERVLKALRDLPHLS
jgi:hypothetical protein